VVKDEFKPFDYAKLLFPSIGLLVGVGLGFAIAFSIKRASLQDSRHPRTS
jgi:hypothetical protein